MTDFAKYLCFQFTPTLAQMKCIVEYLQTPNIETDIWSVLTLQLNTVSGRVYDTNEWKQILSHLIKRLSARQQLFHRKVISSHWVRLSEMEHQLLALLTEDADVASEFPETIVSWDIRETEMLCQIRTHCRICLASNSSQMFDIFDESGTVAVTLLEKIRMCQCFTKDPQVDDAFPQKICLSCSILVENAYQLKKLCSSTEQKFKEIPVEMNLIDNVDQKINENCVLDTSMGLNSLDQCNNDLNIMIDFDQEMEPVLTVEIMEGTQPIQLKQDTEQFICDMCQSTFGSKSSIRRHMDLVHVPKMEIVGAFKCTICPKTFLKPKLLLSHIKTHDTARPYMCDVS